MPETPQFNEEPKKEILSDEEKSRKRVEIAKRTLREQKEKHVQKGDKYDNIDASDDIHSALMKAMDWNEDLMTKVEWEQLEEDLKDLPKRKIREPEYHYKSQPTESLVPLRSQIEESDISEEVGFKDKEEYLETYYHSAVENDTYKDDLEKIKTIFQDQVVVDLGAGEESNGYEIAKDAGAKAYVGVEPYFANNLKQVLEYDSGWSPPEEAMPFSVAKTDMLSFLSALKDNSVSILISGIDMFIISNPEYRKKVVNEFKRVLSENGGVFSCHSELLHSPKQEEAGIEKLNDDTFMYNKSAVIKEGLPNE